MATFWLRAGISASLRSTAYATGKRCSNSPRTEYLDFSADGRLLLTAHEDSGLLSLYLMQSNISHQPPGFYEQMEKKYLKNRDLRTNR